MPDSLDQYPNTPIDHNVDENGYSVYVYLDNNGITIKAYEYANVGDTGEINGETYVVVSEEQLRQYISDNIYFSKVVTTLVTNFEELFPSNGGSNPILIYYDITNWDTSNVIDMTEMFRNQQDFNQDIGDWNTSNVASMGNMFFGAESFNQDIRNRNVSNVTNMTALFYEASSFKQDLSNWDVQNVDDMENMFYNAQSCNQNLSDWCVSLIQQEPTSFSFGSALEQINKPI